MSIVKNTPHYLKHSQSTFTTILNKTIEAIDDPASLGIYLYLASKPNDWEISEAHLRKRFGKGRDFIRARLADLKRIGLLKSVATRDKKGVITRWETILYNEVQNTDFQEYGENTQITENPPSGKTRHLDNPPTTNKRDIKIKDINNHTHSVECDLFLEAEQQRKALMLRTKCIKHQRCHDLYAQLPDEVRQDKTFEDIHDECVTHYATQQEPQLVSPQRLISWIKRDIKYHAVQNQKDSSPSKGNSGDALSRVINKYNSQGGNTYDQHGNTYDPFRR